ncbi:MAG: response regulator [Muribaculaceae bacterium]|nr:response regulator [Muribaculaceae bacterium]
MKRHIYSIAAGAILALSAGTAAEGAPMRHFESIPGSYNHQITAIHQHSDGLLWIGTANGLCVYDGYNVIPAPTQYTDSATFLNDHITKIREDSKGRLWIRAQSHYGIYDPKTQTEDGDLARILEEAGIEGGLINDIESDKDGSIWLNVSGKGLYKIPYGTGKAIKSSFQQSKDFDVCQIIFNKYGSPVIVDQRGALTWIDPSTLKVVDQVEPGPGLLANGKDNYNISLVEKNNRYWVYSPTAIEIYDMNEGKWMTGIIPESERRGTIKSIHQDTKGDVWIARDNHGLERIEKINGRPYFITADRPGDITYGNTITTFFEDNTGTVWLGTQKKGLLSHNDCVHKFRIEELPDVNCMLSSGNTWVWVGTDRSGLWKWNTATGEKYPVSDPAEGNSPAAITSLVSTNDDTLFVGSFSRGLRKVKNGRFEKVRTGTPLDTSFAWSLADDGNGGLWISTLGAGVFHYDPASGETRQFNYANSGLKSDYVNTGIRSKDGRIYFGHSDGISYYDPADGQMHDLTDLNKTFDTTGWKPAQLFEDSRGLLWAATPNGLKVIDRTHGKMTNVKTFQDKNNSISGIIEDNGGSLWISEGRTLTNIKVNYTEKTGGIELTQKHYDITDGLMDSEFNQRSFAKTPSGEILVGGLYGANRFIPAEVRYNSINPKVIFTDLYISNRRIRPGDGDKGTSILNVSLSDGGEVELPHGTKDFTVYFTTDNYALADKTTYHYKLEGYDDQWLQLPQGHHSVTYTNLPSGHYRLMVTGINSDGYESEIPGILPITVLPSFWTSIWAIAIYAVVALLIGLGIYFLMRKIEKKRFEQRMKDQERKKQEEINQLKFQFFTNISHDLRTPLTLIVSPLDEMIKETEEGRQKKRLKLLKDNAQRLLTLVNQLLDFRKNEVAGLNFHPVESDIVAFSKEVCDSFTAMSERKKVNFSFYSDRKEIVMAFDEDKIEKIFMNLLGNAFKFTPSYGRVDVSLEQIGDDSPMLRIKVADSGPGIPDKDKELIFDQFYQANEKGGSQVQMGSGIGLSMVKEYVRLHDGTVRVTDNVEYGSVFIIELPITHITPSPRQDDGTGDKKDDTSGDTEQDEQSAQEEEQEEDNGLPLALVVDDNPDMTEMLKFELEKDFNVITAGDGREALKTIEDEKPAIIVTDLMMPVMDGIELCRKLKSDPETVGIPLIILTAKHDLGVKIEGLTLGADDYITKPFNLDVLKLRMKRLIQLTAKGATRTLIDPEPEIIKVTPLDEKLIENAMKFVSDNIDSPRLSVEELSDHLGMSRVKLYKKIKQITGKTPIEFIRVIRLKRAAQLLRESQLNVSEVAYKTGFGSPKAFSKYFKEEFGILPSVYQDKEGV